MTNFVRAAIAGRLPRRACFDLVIDTFDSVRYFEMDFVARNAASHGARVLDVSSPRALGIWLLVEERARHVTFCNPHAPDLETTRALAVALRVDDRSEFSGSDARALPEGDGGYDVVTSMSVIEHIADGEDAAAVREMWSRVRPGGRLLLTVPVAAAAAEEYLDFDEYGLEPRRDGRYTFGQRFYDAALLAERVFSVTGRPDVMEVYGERETGTFFGRRRRRFTSVAYPHWSEPLHMARRYRRFSSIDALPALGVAAMRFDRR